MALSGSFVPSSSRARNSLPARRRHGGHKALAVGAGDLAQHLAVGLLDAHASAGQATVPWWSSEFKTLVPDSATQERQRMVPSEQPVSMRRTAPSIVSAAGEARNATASPICSAV